MSSFSLKKSASTSLQDLKEPINDSNPIRIAFLGGAKTGKTSTISKLTLGNFRDTYYPTHQVNPILFHYNATTEISRLILDEKELESTLGYLSKQSHILLSPVLYQSYSRLPKKKAIEASHTNDVVISSKNQYYVAYNYKNEVSETGSTINNIAKSTNKAYIPPHISPILVELIDTSGFNPAQVVPFLEASIYVKLDKDILRNLANEPRKPVSTNPLLVASGASELNGYIDGYFFVYSAVPSYNPPSYDEIAEVPADSTRKNSILPAFDPLPGDETFSLLATMKGALDEAWREYNTFKKRWEQGKEHDIFSFKNALKSFWKEESILDVENRRNEIRNGKSFLLENSMDPADPDCPPPIWIICTHSKNQLSSPKLIENGSAVAKHWKCGFVALDNLDDNIDEILALMIKEISERKKLLKGKNKA
ncbi:uncharacterized protein RJT20DRAFT_128380 [Scheffersomyces xylosifermentans]|uniref:uncharacterized protein n=1 Tax=Scheffersomyces xylosifermentans TaxID=1304137 RepID=UPI00315D7DA4